MTLNQLARALGRRPQITCGGCGYTWQPRGKNYSIKCPNCKAAITMARQSSSAGCGCAILLAILAAAVVYAVSRKKSSPVAVSSSTVIAWQDVRASYLANADDGKAKYKGSSIEWAGKLHSSAWSPIREEGLFAVIEADPQKTIFTAWFTAAHEKEVLALKPGQPVSVRCTVGDVTVAKPADVVTISLEGCSLASPIPSASASGAASLKTQPVPRPPNWSQPVSSGAIRTAAPGTRASASPSSSAPVPVHTLSGALPSPAPAPSGG